MTALLLPTRQIEPRFQRRAAGRRGLSPTRLLSALAAVAVGLFISTVALPSVAAGTAGTAVKAAAAPSSSSAAQTRYQQDRAVCLSGASNQDRATCLKEAGAARAEAQKGGLGDSTEPYSDNQRKRCAQLPGSQRQDCLARMQGQGNISGSVAGGGLLRETVTVVPAAAAPAPAPAASAP